MPSPRGGPRGALPPNATVIRHELVSPTILRLRVRPDDPVPAFDPGQYFALGLEAGEGLVQRPYSTSSPRGEDDGLEFLVRLVASGALTPRLWRLREGARLRLGRPKGLFTPAPGDDRRPLLVATGTGIAPMLSILESRLRELPDGGPRRSPLVVHGASHAVDLVGRSRLAALAAEGRIGYVPAVSRPSDPANGGWRGETGRLDAVLPRLLAAHADRSGRDRRLRVRGGGVAGAVEAVLRAHGMPASAIRTEAWSGPGRD